jgi:3-phenylpropionate/cinnamic acid dioxygenase small subunit
MDSQWERIATHYECSEFLNAEAQLLDAGQYKRWLEFLTDDIDYEMAIRVTPQNPAMPAFSEDTFFIKDDKSSLTARLGRLETEYAWCEHPPSMTRRLITNIRVSPDSKGLRSHEVSVRSNILLFRARRDEAGTLLSAERIDLLRKLEDNWLLAKRTIHLDHTVLPMPDVTIPI